jgi:uncharacterized glyoxalase superfamily protein PhnB
MAGAWPETSRDLHCRRRGPGTGPLHEAGFEVSRHDDTYAFAQRENRLTIHLNQGDGGGFGPGAVYLHVDDADAVARAWRSAGLEVEGPEIQDYGKSEGSHIDPDGNLIRFGSPVQG